MKDKKKKSRPEPSLVGAVLASLRGMLVFLAAALVAALPASLIAYSTADPGGYVLPCGLAALYISAVAGGFAAFKFNRGMTLLTGLFCGLTCIAAALLLSLVIPLGFSPSLSPAALFCTRLPVIPLSILGAYVSSVKRKKKKKRRQR